MILSGTLLTTGCSLDDDSYMLQYEGKVKVVMNWEESIGERPEGMSVLFYPTDGAPYWRFELKNEGGTVSLPVGTYNVLAYNSDTSNIIFENTNNYKTALVTSLSSPDELWCANTYTFKTKMPSQTLTLYIKNILPIYTVNVLNVKNADNCYQSSFAISGLSAGRVLSSMSLLSSQMSVSAPLISDGSDAYSGATMVFGREAWNGIATLSVRFNLRDGTEKTYEFDVTSQIDNAPDQYNVVINIADEIELPSIETSGPNSGLDVGLDEWETIDVDLST